MQAGPLFSAFFCGRGRFSHERRMSVCDGRHSKNVTGKLRASYKI